jgi:hypothetical protein
VLHRTIATKISWKAEDLQFPEEFFEPAATGRTRQHLVVSVSFFPAQGSRFPALEKRSELTPMVKYFWSNERVIDVDVAGQKKATGKGNV